jgi:hypothetical protein
MERTPPSSEFEERLFSGGSSGEMRAIDPGVMNPETSVIAEL